MTAEQIASPGTGHRMNRHVVVGVTMILVGIALFAVQRADWDINWWSSWWALLLLCMGIVRFISPGVQDGRPLSRRTGLWLTGIGAWGLISQARLFGLGYSSSWPLLIVIAGIDFIWRAVEQRRDISRTDGRSIDDAR